MVVDLRVEMYHNKQDRRKEKEKRVSRRSNTKGETIVAKSGGSRRTTSWGFKNNCHQLTANNTNPHRRLILNMGGYYHESRASRRANPTVVAAAQLGSVG